jgi:hypothetical protein
VVADAVEEIDEADQELARGDADLVAELARDASREALDDRVVDARGDATGDIARVQVADPLAEA